MELREPKSPSRWEIYSAVGIFLLFVIGLAGLVYKLMELIERSLS